MNKGMFYLAGALLLSASAFSGFAQEMEPSLPRDEPESRVDEGGSASAEPAARSGIEEIVVTARKRKETIQSVPLAVTALSGGMLERANVTDMQALSTLVPSLLIVPGSSGSRSIPTFAIRGQSQQELTILADPSVPVYFNDVVVERQQGVNQALFDIGSIEVLKGPQGTLFGRNSTGGAINIKANTPTDEFEAYVGATVGNYGRFNTTGMLNLPVTGWAQLRVAGQTTDSDGYINDVVLDRMINHEHTKAGRISLALQPMEGLESLFVYSRFIEDDGGTGAFIEALDPDSLARATRPDGSANPTAAALGYTGPYSGEEMLAAQQARGIYDTASGADQFNRVSTWDLANTTAYEFSEGVSIKNIIGHRKVQASSYEDVDGMPIPFLQIGRSAEFEQFSEELQVLGDTGSLRWIVGLYYFNEEGGSDDYSLSIKPVNTAPGNQVPQPHPRRFPGWTLTDPDGENTSESVYAQGTQRLDRVLEGLALTLGARYTWDERVARIRNRGGDPSDPDGTPICRLSRDLDNDPSTPETPAAEVPIDQCDVRFKKSFSEPTYNISLDYQLTPTHLLYLAHRRGYRTGGFGARAGTEAGLSSTFNAETVTDFEVGTKNDFMLGGRPLRLNLALYQADYDDIQRLLLNPELTPPTTASVNAGKATIRGGELELTFLPFDDLQISGFYSYTDASYDEFEDCGTPDPTTTNGCTDRSDQPFARAPENIYSLTVRYAIPVASNVGEPGLQLNYFHTDGYSASDTYAPEQSIEGYELVNFRADWRGVLGSSFDLGFSVKNLLDEEYALPFGDVYTPAVLGVVGHTAGEPRTYLFDIKYRFGPIIR